MSISESAVRSRLRRKGWELQKCRSRNEADPSFGRYVILDPFRNIAVEGQGEFPYMLDLEDADDLSRDLDKNWRM